MKKITIKEDLPNYSKNIKRRMHDDLCITTHTLALSVGASDDEVNRWRRGTKAPNREYIQRLMIVLGGVASDYME